MAAAGGSRCALHTVAVARAIDQRRRKERGPRKYDTRAWRDGVRPQQLRLEPFCRMCRSGGLFVEATEVDHIDGDNTNDARHNLQSLCKPCHSRKTVAEQGAFAQRLGPSEG